MEENKNLVRVEDESGNSYDMLILKEFDYKKKKYAVLMEMNHGCDDTCDCGCKDHDCDDTCDCDCKDHDCDCDCCNEPALCILEITKDENGEEIFASIEDDKLYDEIIKEADKVLYD